MRDSFASRIGMVLATAGSAVGLGNVWRFPYMTGENGGAAFILIYIACIFMLGMPGMISEFIVGRHSQANAVRAYTSLSGGRRGWGLIGVLGVVTGLTILGFYSVVAGWCLDYLGVSLVGGLRGDAASVERYFSDFTSKAWQPALLAIAFLVITHLVVVRGVQRGIERASKVLMPLLFILLIVIVVSSCMLPGAADGIRFLFYPDFSKVTHHTLLAALGQAFFSLSLGTCCLCTYASYFRRDTNLVRSATEIAFLDTLIAIMAGLMIFPAAFAVGVQPDSGPSLVFITLPNVFRQAFAAVPLLGWCIAVLFYALLVFAALTSTISMHEIGTAYFAEEHHLSRKTSASIVTVLCAILAVGCSLSFGATDSLQVMGMSLLDFCDHVTSQYMLPLGAFLTSIFLGWFISNETVRSEFTNEGTVARRLFPIYRIAIRYVVPICILLIFLDQTGLL